jgi:hypothetical protein
VNRALSCALLFVGGVFAQGPSEFYVATVGLSDFNPSWGNEIIEVEPDGNDTLVRDILVANLDAFCRIPTVKLAEVRLKATSPAQVVAANNPCAVRPATVRDAVREFQRGRIAARGTRAGAGIVAECGSQEVVLRLPSEQGIYLARMQQRSPKIAALWTFANEVQKRAFGDSNAFPEAKSWELQEAGRAVVPELLSGRLSKGFVDGRMPNDLSDYRGPIKRSEYEIKLENLGAYQFKNYVAPDVPPQFKRAGGTRGKVMLQLTVMSGTGAVLDVVTLSGYPPLQAMAAEAAKKWRFVPGSTSAEPLFVVLDFASRCP